MNQILNWIKQNKILTVVLLVVAYYFIGNFISKNTIGVPISNKAFVGNGGVMMDVTEESYSMGAGASSRIALDSYAPVPTIYEPETQTEDRKIISEISFSVLVNDVKETAQKLEDKAYEFGGFVINRNETSNTEESNGYITMRIPSDRAEEYKNYLEANSIRIININKRANDITAQFEDLEKRKNTLERTQSRLEDLYEQASTVDQILSVQNQILSNQRQLDSVLGQIKAIDAKTNTTLITVTLTTDELALSYVPGTPWSPKTTYKLAVRSLILNLRGLADLAINLVVFTPIWLPIVLIAYFARNKYKAKNSKDSKN